MSTEILLLVYCLLIVTVSVGGGLIPLVVRLTHRRMQLAISLVAGVMLGVGMLHMLPHAIMGAPGRPEPIFAYMLGGFLVMFFIERFFCFHHHDVPMPFVEPGDRHLGEVSHQHAQAGPNCHGHIHNEAHKLGWMGVSIGLTLHTIIAGIALAASVEAERAGVAVTAIAGFGTFIAIVLHKPFDAMTITTLMTAGAWKKSSAHLVNGLFALMIPVGVGLFYLGLSHAGNGESLIAYALAFSAGTFLCVSMSDLLPELQFHSHDRVGLSISLLLGLSVAGGVGLLESGNHNHADHGDSLTAVENANIHDHGYKTHAVTATSGQGLKTMPADGHGTEHNHGKGAHAHEEMGDDHEQAAQKKTDEHHHNHAPASATNQAADPRRQVVHQQ